MIAKTTPDWLPVEPVCAECGTPIDLDDCEHRAEGVAEAPDGLPAPVLVAVCHECGTTEGR